MSQKQLTAKVRLNTTQAEQKLKALGKAIDALNNAVGRQSNAYNKVNNALKTTTNQTKQAKQQTDKLAASANKVNRNFHKTGSTVGMLSGKLKRLVNTYLGVMGTKAMIDTSDIITSSENKLNNVMAKQLGTSGVNSDGSYSVATINATRDAMDKMYNSSQKVRMSYTDMMSNVAKSMTLAGDAFQNNTDNAIRFQEIMAEAYAIGGASAPEMSTSMYQLMQALGSGVLAGDELRSVREGAPLAYKAIEEFAQKVYNTEESLKDLGSQGKITSEMVIAAIMNAGDEMDSAFAQTAQTFAQTWEQIKNVAKKAFEPISRMLRDALNRAMDNGLIDKVEVLFGAISLALQGIFNLISSVIGWIADNWYWLQYVVYSVITVIILHLTVLATQAIITGLKMFWAFLTSLSPLYIWIVVIGILVGAIVWLANTAVTGCEFIIYALLMVGVALTVIALLTQAWWLLWVALAVAVVALIIACLEEVVGGVYWLGATCYNIGVGFLNGLMQAIHAMFVEPIASIIEWFVNAFSGGFDGILGAAANAIGQLVSLVLSGLKVITKAIDAVGGTNLTAKITGWQNSAKSWGKNSNAVDYSVEAPQFKRISAMDAYAKGAQKGAEWSNSIDKFGSDLKDKISGFDLGGKLSNLGNNLGLGELGKMTAAMFPETSIGDGTGGLGGSGYDPSNALKGIKGDTGKMADAMELTQEDLEYLRDVANMEWKKEFTTASIVVDMSNYNTINGDNDLDGIVTKLTDRLYEELQSVADGVYV